MCEEVFNGRFNQELYHEYGQWLPFIEDIFYPIVDTETGDLRSLPFPGTILDQPYMTIQVIKQIQLNYRIIHKKKLDAQKKKGNI